MTEEQTKISIIVPVYNVEQYIERCVKSLMRQDYSNIEMILVDDGSPDQAGEMIDRLAKQDRRIKVIHKANGGVSSARNAGVEAATGDYLMFVDGDDWVDSDYVSYFLHLAQKYNAAIAMNTVNYAWNGKKKNKEFSTYTISAEKAAEWIYNDKLFVAVWNKIYKADIFQKVRFSEDIWYGEGMLFNIECLQLVDQVAIGDKPVYHQTFNPQSAMRNFNLKSNFCGIASLWLQRAKWKKTNKSLEKEWRYHRYRFNKSIIDGLVRTEQRNQYKAIYQECVRGIRQDIFFALRQSKTLKQRIGWLGYYFCPYIIARLQAYRFNNILKNRGGNLTLFSQCRCTFNCGGALS